VNSAAVNAGVLVSLLYADLHSWRNVQHNHYGSSIFSFLEDLHTDFYSGCTSLYSHQLYKRVPFSSVSSPLSVVIIFLIQAILTGVRGNLNVLFCISFMGKDIEGVFTGHLCYFF
jgi:hypothetical protein